MLEELVIAMFAGIVKASTFVVFCKVFQDREKTTPRPPKQKGGFFK